MDRGSLNTLCWRLCLSQDWKELAAIFPVQSHIEKLYFVAFEYIVGGASQRLGSENGNLPSQTEIMESTHGLRQHSALSSP